MSTEESHQFNKESNFELAVALPEIAVTNRQLRDISEDALNSLVSTNEPPQIFVRSARLTRVIRDEKDRPIVQALGDSDLRACLARSANWVKEASKEKRKGTNCFPPPGVVKDLLALGNWPGLPSLDAIVEVPIIRDDGSILDRAGYDPRTGLVYTPPSDFVLPAVPQNPTETEVRLALSWLIEAVGEFPYADRASHANLLGLLVTLVTRQTFGKVPLALIDAPEMGTGKGLLAEVIILIATGGVAAMMGAPTEEEEWRKAITSVLLGGSTVVVIDNVDRPLKSPHLCRALTASEWKDRLLSTNLSPSLPQRATWIATGNNIQLDGDMVRRGVWIRLDSRMPNPWQRTGFKHPDLLAWVKRNRGQLLAALLTIVRAWFAAGRPKADIPMLGSFEDWAATVGSVLAHAGVNGFLGNQTEILQRSDTSRGEWEAFLRGLQRHFGEKIIATREIAQAIETHDELRHLLPAELADAFQNLNRSFKHQLGGALARQAGPRHGDDGIYLDRASGDAHEKVCRWQVKFSERNPAGANAT